MQVAQYFTYGCYDIGQLPEQQWAITNAGNDAQSIKITITGGDVASSSVLVVTCDRTQKGVPVLQVVGEQPAKQFVSMVVMCIVCMCVCMCVHVCV